MIMRKLRTHPTMYYNLNIKSSDSINTVANLAVDPRNERRKVANAI